MHSFEWCHHVTLGAQYHYAKKKKNEYIYHDINSLTFFMIYLGISEVLRCVKIDQLFILL